MTGLKTLFNFAYLFIPSMSTSAKAKTIIPKVTKALAWKYFGKILVHAKDPRILGS